MRPSARKVASLYLARSSCIRVKGGKRSEYLDAVWEMYAKTYASIGLHIPNRQGLLKYQEWEICLNGDSPVQFTLFKTTPYGLKSGLSGHDGSSEGKSKAVAELRSKFKKSGYYGEVSHKVKDIVVASGAPAVCPSYVKEVLRQPITPVGDGLEYERALGDLGPKTKMMVGRPRGVPTTDPRRPECPAANATRLALGDDCDFCDEDAHFACIALDDLD